ncbi:MAG TPA: hypothetical protein VFH43_05185 [Candidatus Kapabacteria bacterium]|nr:hypothetical protein [Candidatus Kapabacteria bacterium]
MSRLRVILLGLGMLLLAACDAAHGPLYLSEANPEKLRGKTWEWVGYTTLNGGYQTDVPAGSYFHVDSVTVKGVSGCDAFTGACSIGPGAMQISSVEVRVLDKAPRKSYICQLTESSFQYRQRDSLLVLVPQSGEMVHLFFKQK